MPAYPSAVRTRPEDCIAANDQNILDNDDHAVTARKISDDTPSTIAPPSPWLSARITQDNRVARVVRSFYGFAECINGTCSNISKNDSECTKHEKALAGMCTA